MAGSTLDDLRSRLSTAVDPCMEVPGRYRPASVLVVIYGDEPFVIMTKKPGHMKFHAGEISFPGGKRDPGDADLLETALRETREEIGLLISRGQVTGQLEPVATLNSGFLILPFVSVVGGVPGLSANSSEVEEIFHMPLERLLATGARDTDPAHGATGGAYAFGYRGQTVWGASARILQQIRNCLRFI